MVPAETVWEASRFGDAGGICVVVQFPSPEGDVWCAYSVMPPDWDLVGAWVKVASSEIEEICK